MGTGWERYRHLDARTPVIIGVGRAAQQPDRPGQGLDALGLMCRAAEAAGADCGSPGVLSRLGRVAVPEGTRRYRDAGRLIARVIGSDHAHTVSAALGIPQQTLLNDCYRSITAGDTAFALVVGGESAGRDAQARRAGASPTAPVDGDEEDPGERQVPDGDIVDPVEINAGLVDPPAAYAVIDCALRAAEGLTLEEHHRQIDDLWSGFSRVAAGYPHAAFPTERSPEWLRTPSDRNRPIAFPYNKWHCSQMYVDQAGAVLVGGLGSAEEAGVDPRRIVFPSVALESSFTVPVIRRRQMHRWPAMELLGRAAATHLGDNLSAIPHLEIYSCFPAAVRVQQRALGLPVTDVPTITGGMAFAGGPFNNFVLQATVAMIEHLRRHPGDRGLVSTVSGFLNKPGLAVYSTEPHPAGLLVADLASDAASATVSVATDAAYSGPARVVAHTVVTDRGGGRRTIVVVDTASGRRAAAASDDADLADRATIGDLVGTTVWMADGRWAVLTDEGVTPNEQ